VFYGGFISKGFGEVLDADHKLSVFPLMAGLRMAAFCAPILIPSPLAASAHLQGDCEGDGNFLWVRILIVEDNPVNLDLVMQLLEDDYELLTAEDGQSGIDIALAERPDLILLDLS